MNTFQADNSLLKAEREGEPIPIKETTSWDLLSMTIDAL